MPEPRRTELLASDLDGTVVAVNTFPHFVGFLTRRLLRDRRLLALSRLLAVGALRKAGVVGHDALKHVVCTLGATVPEPDVREWAAGMLARHGHPDVIELIRGWHGDTLLTTAAPELYAVHLADLLGIPEVHGSAVTGGVLVNNESDRKCVRLRAAGIERVAVFLTDDMVLDAPMAELADRVYEVAPGGSLREQLGGPGHAGV